MEKSLLGVEGRGYAGGSILRRGSKLAANVEASVKPEPERGQRATGTEDREPGKGSRRYTEQLCFLYLLWRMRVGLKGAPGAGGFVEPGMDSNSAWPRPSSHSNVGKGELRLPEQWEWEAL